MRAFDPTISDYTKSISRGVETQIEYRRNLLPAHQRAAIRAEYLVVDAYLRLLDEEEGVTRATAPVTRQKLTVKRKPVVRATVAPKQAIEADAGTVAMAAKLADRWGARLKLVQ